MNTPLIIFDLDGVLVDSKEVHFNALNLALSTFGNHFMITQKEQNEIFEGLTTKHKLDVLTKIKGLPEQFHNNIWKLKQEYTSTLFESISIDNELVNLFKFIKSNGINIAIASNSIRKTLDTCIINLGLKSLVDYSLSNEDVLLPKPDPEIYNKCIEYFNVNHDHVVIFEDSEIGIKAAMLTGACVEKVANRKDLYFDRIARTVGKINEA